MEQGNVNLTVLFRKYQLAEETRELLNMYCKKIWVYLLQTHKIISHTPLNHCDQKWRQSPECNVGFEADQLNNLRLDCRIPGHLQWVLKYCYRSPTVTKLTYKLNINRTKYPCICRSLSTALTTALRHCSSSSLTIKNLEWNIHVFVIV